MDYPIGQTCCGQPLANSGYERYTKEAIKHFEKLFNEFDLIVAPSASCVLFLKEHPQLHSAYKSKILELTEFIIEHGEPNKIDCSYAKKVGVLQSCHGLRGLQLGNPSELMNHQESKLFSLLSKVKGIQLVELDRPDDCCGFGGTFCVKESTLSAKMGKDRLEDFMKNGAEVITGTDVSCLMHLEGLIKKNSLPLEVKHISEILCQP